MHSDLGLRFDRLSRLAVRLESPLLDGFKRGGKKHLWTTDYLEALNLPILAYSSQQHNRPFDRLWLRQERLRDRRRCEFDDPGRKAYRFGRFDLAGLIVGVRIDHVSSRKSLAAGIKVNGVIPRAKYLMVAATRYHFHRKGDLMAASVMPGTTVNGFSDARATTTEARCFELIRRALGPPVCRGVFPAVVSDGLTRASFDVAGRIFPNQLEYIKTRTKTPIAAAATSMRMSHLCLAAVSTAAKSICGL